VVACFPYWAQVGHIWQNVSMSLDMFGQKTASLAKRRQYSARQGHGQAGAKGLSFP